MPTEALNQGEKTQSTVEVEKSLLELVIDVTENGGLGQTPDEQAQGKDWVKAFLEDLMRSQSVISKDTEELLSTRIADLDKLLSLQVNEIMHSPDFQKMESTWRGLHYLIDQSETSTSLKIKVMNVTKRELFQDLSNAIEFDQSKTFIKVYEEEFGTLGGEPFGALLGDYYFGRKPEDIILLEKMSNVAAAAHAPFLTAPAPELFNMTEFTELPKQRDLSKIFEGPLYAKWKSFRESEDSKYVGMVMPHILMRLPYGENNITVDEFKFEEDVDGLDHKKYLWGNAAYAFVTRMTDAFAKYEWCASIRGVQNGGLVEGLPAHTFESIDGDVQLKCPTEVAIPERRENELSNLGFIPLCHHKGADKAVFFAAQSVQKPTRYLDDDANANARLSSQLQYSMAICRFAHFLKLMMRDKIGSYTSRETCEKDLNDWIAHYVLLDDSAAQEHKAKYPLREARIEVSEVPGKPGSFTARAFLRPHFQLDEISISLNLVARLPDAARS
jgi:type VI secretion system protein ImpC